MSQEFSPPPKRDFIANIFLSPDEPRLRAGWRLAIQTVLMVFLLGCTSVVFVIISIGGGTPPDVESLSTPLILIFQILQAGAFILSVFLARRFLDRRSIESLGLKPSLQALVDVMAGIGITFLQMGLIFFIMLGLGWSTFTGFAWQTDSLATVAVQTLLFFTLFLFTGFSEEILSRGYHLQTIASGLNLTWGVILSSAIFGWLHIFNPDATWVSTFGIFIAGLFFAYAYVRSKQLWLPIGLHIGWNFFEGVVFGFPVSGLDVYPLARIQVTGPELWTGGAFGPEAGLIILPALILGAASIHVFTKNRDAVV